MLHPATPAQAQIWYGDEEKGAPFFVVFPSNSNVLDLPLRYRNVTFVCSITGCVGFTLWIPSSSNVSYHHFFTVCGKYHYMASWRPSTWHLCSCERTGRQWRWACTMPTQTARRIVHTGVVTCTQNSSSILSITTSAYRRQFPKLTWGPLCCNSFHFGDAIYSSNLSSFSWNMWLKPHLQILLEGHGVFSILCWSGCVDHGQFHHL